MGDSLTRKIIRSHMVKGAMVPGEDVFVSVDQTLTHDINAVMTYLGFEQLGIPTQVKTSVAYMYRDRETVSATWYRPPVSRSRVSF